MGAEYHLSDQIKYIVVNARKRTKALPIGKQFPFPNPSATQSHSIPRSQSFFLPNTIPLFTPPPSPFRHGGHKYTPTHNLLSSIFPHPTPFRISHPLPPSPPPPPEKSIFPLLLPITPTTPHHIPSHPSPLSPCSPFVKPLTPKLSPT